jgi:hypothetical protein
VNRVCWRLMISLIAWTVSAAAIAEPVAPQPEPSVTSSGTVENVLIEAPEPRYVAPTRRDRIGRIWAPVLINGRGPFRLVLDTGANSSAVIDSVAARLGIPLLATRTVNLQGVTGSALVPTIAVNRMEVGELYMEGTTLPVVSDVFGGAEGVLGSEGLGDKRIFIDFGHDQILISRSHSQPPPAGYARVPLKLIRDRLLMFNVTMGTIRTKAILDTGAQQTIGNNALRELLVKRARDNAKSQDIVGVTLAVERGDSIAAPPLSFGGMEVRQLNITFGDMFIFDYWKLTHEPALLIGMDVIGSLDVMIIDYKLRELQIRARG